MMTQTEASPKRSRSSPPKEVDEKRGRGRPTKPPEEKLEGRSIRLYPSIWEKIELYGLDWARDVLKRAKPPKK